MVVPLEAEPFVEGFQEILEAIKIHAINNKTPGAGNVSTGV